MFGRAQQSLAGCDARSLSGVELENAIAQLMQSLNLLEGSPQRFQGAFMHKPATSRARTGHQDPSTPGGPTNQNQESPFSRTPAYFNPELYNEWLGKLSEPWRKEDAWDSES